MTPNWQHHSKKERKGKGACKGKMRARRQALRALKAKICNGRVESRPSLCYN